MRASLDVTVYLAGQTDTISQERTEDGASGLTPTLSPATAGFLTTRSSNTAGTISTLDPEVETGDKGVLTWTDVNGNLKHRYNVDCTVTNVGIESGEFSGEGDVYETAFSGGAGDNLPTPAGWTTAINIAKQVAKNITFDFDELDTLFVTTNVRGVVVFLDAANTADPCVIDMAANNIAIWTRSAGFPQPKTTYDPITHVLLGSGDTSATNFKPKILTLFDATYSGQ